ncbi:MAG: Na+/H+ antiporter subunit E [Candidatus Methanospirareceae archaeon]
MGFKSKGEKAFSMIVTFCAMLIFWVLLSAWIIYIPQHYDLIEISKGIICSLIVTLISHELLVSKRGEKVLLKTLRLIPYLGWELWQIVMANFDVAYRVIHPKMPIDPRIIEFETTLRSDFALTTLANSITLTPGTITILVKPETGKFWVHAIAEKPADALLVDKTMQRKVAHVYMEE